MPPFDAPRRERCAQFQARGASVAQASKKAGYPRHNTRAVARAAHPAMVRRIGEIKAEMARQGDPDLGPVIDALLAAASEAGKCDKIRETAAGLVAIRGLLAEAARLKALVPKQAPLDYDLMEPDLPDDVWMARFGPGGTDWP